MPSKLGIHSILSDETVRVVRELAEAGAPMGTVKAVESMGWLADVKAVSPQTVTLGRYINGKDGKNVESPPLDGDLHKSARDVMDNILPQWEPHRAYVDYWEIVNEMDPTSVDGHRRLAELMIYCMDIAEAQGYKVALFSYSLGVPEWNEIEAIVSTGVFARAKAGGHVLALHEYAYPIDKWYGEPLPGRPTYPNRGPLSCRYRWWYEDFLKPRDEVVPLYLTEINLSTDSRKLTPEEWLRQIAWYDERLREDAYVAGAHLFTLGAPNTNWDNYKFNRMLPLLTKHILDLKDVADPLPEDHEPPQPPEPPVPPEPPKPVEPQPCAPRESYSRHYLLLPPGANWDWVLACRRYWETFQVTIGSSADDAGYGPGLAERIVTAINPGGWPSDLQAFFTQYYPGVRYDPILASTPQELARALERRVATGRRLG